MTKLKQKNIIVIGGGTGSFVILSGLKQYPVNLTAIVPVTDDGGSTGRLRDEFGFLPVGDIRQCLAALASENGLLRQMLLYRFNKGKGLAGHNLGNLILTALEDLVGSEPEAVIQAAKIFKLKGRILPISKKLVKLKAEYSDGQEIVSEHLIETHKLKPSQTIKKLYIVPQAQINPHAKQAILTADLIVLAPGDLFNSIIANLVIKGTKQAIKKSTAKLVYVVNLMTLNSQTHDFTAKDHLRQIEKYTGKKVNYILVNKKPIPQKIKQAYQKLDEYEVKDDLNKDPRVKRANLIAKSTYHKPKSDRIKRSLLRHHPQKLAKAIIDLIKE